MDIGKQIKDKRTKERLSAQALADLISVSMDNIYKWEKGTKISDPEDYKKINDWLGNKLDYFPIILELQKMIGVYEERFIRIEAILEVYESAIVELLTKGNDSFTQKVGELRELVKEAVNRRYDEQKKKQL